MEAVATSKRRECHPSLPSWNLQVPHSHLLVPALSIAQSSGPPPLNTFNRERSTTVVSLGTQLHGALGDLAFTDTTCNCDDADTVKVTGTYHGKLNFKKRSCSTDCIYSSLFFLCFQGTGVTKVKIKQKEKEGIAEKRSGRRGPSSVWGSGAAGVACALAATVGLGGSDFSYLWQLGFAASFSTKLSDTVASEIGKAYGTTTYLVTTGKVVPRGTEGAVSLEGTLAGLSASLLFCTLAYNLNQVTARDALICIIGSQFANLLESYAGATLQDKKGFEWLNNDVVNVLNISFGAALAIAVSYACNFL
ncbi:hypothetical protein L7F22_003505 [Adiantum nelumboides]|nr:hypothetical protein [Adiantum nelumboides]